MNLGTIRTLTSNLVGDPDQTRFAGKYDDAINRAQEQFALDSKALWKDVSYTHATNDADELLPGDFMWEDWVTYDGKEITPISRHELNRLNHNRDWTADAATSPTHFIIDPEQAVKKIVLYPIPTDAKTLIMRYFPLPTTVSNDTDVPLNSSSLLAQFHTGLASYAGWMLLTYEELTPAIKAKKTDLLAVYNDMISKAVDNFKNTVSAGLHIKGSRIYK